MRRDLTRESRIVALYRDGASLQAIATDFGISRERVRQIVIQAGETPRRGLRDLSAGIAMYQSGKSMADIADALNCGQQSVAGFLRRNGVAIRPVGRPQKGERARLVESAGAGRANDARPMTGLNGQGISGNTQQYDKS